ncbi:MAG: hypothetical protein GF365_00675 [Candidatus Buchananbacteria bacterium]|nr:hypothetical protein [Candidatus Buchananbacteria bacterium]
MRIIKFNKKIYRPEAIKQAINDFKNLANFKLKENSDYIEIKINKIDQDYKDILKDEFANYALGLMS